MSQFKNFRSSNGPDLRVYLSTDQSDDNEFIDIGNLSSTSGTLGYDFPTSQYNAAFDNILIWCQDFSILFDFAELMQ